MSIKNIFLFFLLIISSNTFQAQNTSYNLKGKVLDKLSENPLENATVVYLNKSIGTTTNINGVFNLTIRANDVNDSINISFLGYKNLKISIGNFLKLPDSTIYLEQNFIALDEIILKNSRKEEKIPAKAFFRKIQKNFSKSVPDYSYISKAHYKEKVKYYDTHVLFSESIGYAVNMGDLNNASYLSRYKFFYKNTKLANIDSLWKQKIKKKHNLKSDLWINGSANLNQYLRLIKYGVLSKKWNKYKFNLDSTYYKNHQKIYRISFKGKNEKGYLDCVVSDFKILKINYTTDNYPTNIFNKYIEADISISFQYFNENVFLSEMKSSYNYGENFCTNEIKIISQNFSNFNIKSNAYWGANTLSTNPYIFYNFNEWENFNFTDDKDLDAVKKDLAKEIALETQYKNNSGKRLYPKKSPSNFEMQTIAFIKLIEDSFYNNDK